MSEIKNENIDGDESLGTNASDKNNIYNTAKCIIVNIVLLCIVFVFIMYLIDNNYFMINKNSYLDIKKNETDFELYTDTFKRLEYSDNLFNQFCGETRLSFGEKYKKNPIILLGCSYCYGHGLKKEQSFPYLLSEATKRPVYSFCNCGSDIIDSLIHLNNETAKNKQLKEIFKNADYVIYIYQYDHIMRYLNPHQYDYIIRKYSNNPGVSTIIREILAENEVEKFLMKNNVLKLIILRFKLQKSDEYLKKIINNTNRYIKNLCPKADFICIVYDEKIPLSKDNENYSYVQYVRDVLYSDSWDKIENVTVIQTKDIVGFPYDKNYKLNEDITGWHPNAKVWKNFVPAFSEKYIK
ncbi:MAG: hypothetical protein K6C94_04160 [Candidatus Gastranaerophilales bacterium]|nr:hypothetical protein [Candidatus Gastranaerophilales bacterium]